MKLWHKLVVGYLVVALLGAVVGYVQRSAFSAYESIGVAVLGTLALVLVCGTLAGYFPRQIGRVRQGIQSVGEGNFEVRVQEGGADELAELGSSFNRRVDNLSSCRDALQVTRDYASGVFSSMLDALVVVSPRHTIETVNPATCALLGYSEGELVGQPLGVILADEFLPAEMEQELRVTGSVKEVEAFFLRKTGGTVPVELSVSTLRATAGVPAALVCIGKDVSDRLHAEKQITYMAYYDGLTGLPNRAQFESRLEEAIALSDRNDSILALQFLDVDNFKYVNDTLGHRIGDLLLKEVARRLKVFLRKGDMLARLGGDEFTLINVEINSAEDAGTVAERIVQAFAEPLTIEGNEIFLTASVGVAIYPHDSATIEDLVRSADLAMYSAKAKGKNTWQFFTPDMNAKVQKRQAMEASLRRALETEEFVLYYQPQFDMKSGRLVGAEALVRWRHPEMGMVSPGEFIPVAEESGLIVSLGDWVTRTACLQQRRWQEAGLPPLKMAVNLSGGQIGEELVSKVETILAQTAIEPRYLTMELTESILMYDTGRTVAVMQGLRALGVELAIDDFGTGYSSLSYLSRFPLFALKIDRSFVRDVDVNPNDATIAKAIVAMARGLGLQVIAEGVETEGHLACLREMGCTLMQGFLFGAPLPVGEFERLFAAPPRIEEGAGAADPQLA